MVKCADKYDVREYLKKNNLDLSQIDHKGNSVTKCDTCYAFMKYFNVFLN